MVILHEKINIKNKIINLFSNTFTIDKVTKFVMRKYLI